MIYYEFNGELTHHGILGQKWGVRRYQNEDGSLTAAGKKHYRLNDGRLNNRGISKANSDIKKANRLLDDYKKRSSKFQSSVKIQKVSVPGIEKQSEFQIYNSNLKSKADRSYNKYSDFLNRTISSLKESDYSVGYDFVKDNYYLRKLDDISGDPWSFTKIEM